MLIKVNGDLLAVNFRHGVESAVKPSGHKNRNAGRHYTVCKVRLQRFITGWKDSKNKKHDTTISFFDEVASGKSTCSFGDKFNKVIGRALSFSRAIESSNNELIKNNVDEIIHQYCEAEGIPEITEIIYNMDENPVPPPDVQMSTSSANQAKVECPCKTERTIKVPDEGKCDIRPTRMNSIWDTIADNLHVDVVIHK